MKWNVRHKITLCSSYKNYLGEFQKIHRLHKRMKSRWKASNSTDCLLINKTHSIDLRLELNLFIFWDQSGCCVLKRWKVHRFGFLFNFKILIGITKLTFAQSLTVITVFYWKVLLFAYIHYWVCTKLPIGCNRLILSPFVGCESRFAS